VGPALTGGMKEKTAFLYPAKFIASYTWKDGRTFQLVLRYIESPHTETLTCHFTGNKLELDIERSFDYGKNKVVLTGEIK